MNIADIKHYVTPTGEVITELHAQSTGDIGRGIITIPYRAENVLLLGRTIVNGAGAPPLSLVSDVQLCPACSTRLYLNHGRAYCCNAACPAHRHNTFAHQIDIMHSAGYLSPNAARMALSYVNTTLENILRNSANDTVGQEILQAVSKIDTITYLRLFVTNPILQSDIEHTASFYETPARLLQDIHTGCGFPQLSSYHNHDGYIRCLFLSLGYANRQLAELIVRLAR